MPPPSSRRLPARAPWIALGSALLIGLLPFVACPRIERWRGQAEADEALSALRGCLGGSLDEDALRARVIGADLTGDGWPGRCGEHAATAEVALTRAELGLEHCDGQCCADDRLCVELARRRQLLAQLRKQLEFRRFEGGVAAALLQTTPAGPLSAPPPRAPPPPGPPLVSYDHDASAFARTASGLTLMLHAQGKRADLCTIEPTGRSRCRIVPPSVPVADAVLLVDGAPAAPPHLLAREPEIAPERWALHAADGRVIIDVEGQTPLGASEDRVLVRGRGGYQLLTGEGERLDLESNGPPLLFGDTLYLVRDRRLVVGDSEIPLPGLDPETLALEACDGEIPMVLAIADDGAAETRGAVVFPDSRVAHPVAPGARWFGFTCSGQIASLTWIEERAVESDSAGARGAYAIHRIRCRPSGCVPEEVTVPLTRHQRGSRYLVASLGEEIALVWRAPPGDVRYRRGPLRDLADAPAHVLFDDAAHGGLAFEASAELLVVGGQAVLLVDAPEATHGYLLGAAGPIALSPE